MHDVVRDAQPLVEVRGVRKAFGPVHVLDGIDLELVRGSVVALAGANGSGKSTLLRCLAGLARHCGEVLVEGVPVAHARHRVGYIPQAVDLPAWPTVDEVLALFARLRHAGARPTLLPDGFLPPGDVPVGHLSGGQRQRVAVAATLLGEPSVLLLDEPAANLDTEACAALWQVVQSAAHAGAAALIATPSPDDLAYTADRVVNLAEGRLQPSAAPSGSRRNGQSDTGSVPPRLDREAIR